MIFRRPAKPLPSGASASAGKSSLADDARGTLREDSPAGRLDFPDLKAEIAKSILAAACLALLAVGTLLLTLTGCEPHLSNDIEVNVNNRTRQDVIITNITQQGSAQ
jgi:hypothetical protein